MNKALSVITSEILLTIITLTLIIPVLAHFETILDTDTNEKYRLTALSCITYRYVNETTILMFDNCEENIQLYSILGTNISVKMLYYNASTNNLEETKIIYAKGLHLIIMDKPITKIALNTSEGILIIEK